MALLAAARTLAGRSGTLATGDVYRPPALSAGQRAGAPVLSTANVLMAILLPSNQAGREQLGALGTERSRYLGWVAPTVSVLDGDEWHIGGVTYTVDAAETVVDFVICALSVQRRGA